MPRFRRLLRTSRVHRQALTLALACLALLGLLAQTIVVPLSHAHRHVVFGAAVSANEHADKHAGEAMASLGVDEHDHHHHSGDSDTDLQNLGHTHTGGASPGLPPAWSFQTAVPEVLRMTLPANERPPGDSLPDTPFRPPIA